MAVHTIPINDERTHGVDVECWCDPEVIWLDPDTGLPWAFGSCVVRHHAADCRELAEGDGESMAPGKQWSIVET